jgi:outer membrane protein OmpA-like peptidoglycan-associated protein
MSQANMRALAIVIRSGSRGLYSAAAMLVLALAVTAAQPARADYVYGSFGGSNVTVDLSVLNRLGPAPTVPDSRFVIHSANGSRVAHRQAAPRRVAHNRIQHIGSVTIDYSALPPAGSLTASAGPRIALHMPGTQTETVAASVPPASSGPQGPADSAVKPPVGNAVATAPPAPTPATPATPPNMPQVAALPPSFSGFSRLVPAASPPDTPTPEPGAALAATPPPTAPVAIPKSDSGAVRFAPGASDLGGDARSVLDGLAQKLNTQPSQRIQLIAYASAPGSGEDDAIEARRTSLARAVVVRAYLIQRGISSARIDVRALGNRADGAGSPDRVDLMILGS